MPATAMISSLSPVSPEMPTAPSNSISCIPDQYTAGIRHKTAATRGHDGGKKIRVLRGPLHHGARAPTHTECAIGFADRNLGSNDTRAIFAFGADNVTAVVEHELRLRHLFVFTSLLQRGIDDA